MITLWVISVFVLVFWILVSNLIGLHIYLICKGLTTYQFIMLQREEERKKKFSSTQSLITTVNSASVNKGQHNTINNINNTQYNVTPFQ